MWIDIKKEKPTEGQCVFVWLSKTQYKPNARTAIYHICRSYSSGPDGEMVLIGEFDSWSGIDFTEEKNITHWQPMTLKKPK